MTAWIRARVSSLGWHLLMPMFLAIGGVLAAHAFVSFRSTKEDFHTLVSGEAKRSSGLILRTTHDGMLLNRKDQVQATIERLSEGEGIAVVRVYDKEGTVVMSSRVEEIGESVSLETTPCTNCHAEGLQDEDPFEAFESVHVENGEVIRQLSVITNEPGCTVAGCHDLAVGDAVLGVLEVEMSMSPLDSALTSARNQLIRTTVALMLAICVITVVIFRRLIYRPIRLLQHGVRLIAQGDLSARIEVPGGHELSSLARDFNHMALDLSGMQEELTGWSQKL